MYYDPSKRSSESQALGFIDLALAIDIHMTVDNYGLRKEEGRWVFQVDTPTRIYYLQATTEADMQRWITGMKAITSGGVRSSLTDSLKSSGPSSNSRPGSSAGSLASPTPASSSNSPYQGKKDVYEFGRLTVKVIEMTGAPLSLNNVVGVYNIITFEKQEVKTKTVPLSARCQWDEIFAFDVSNIRSKLKVDVWGQYPSTIDGRLLGYAEISVSEVKEILETRESGTPLAFEKVFNLQGQPEGHPASTAANIRIEYNPTPETVGPNDFELLKVVGRGNFGKVLQVRKKDTGRIYAMKVLQKSDIIAADAVRHTLAESSVLRRISHPFIVNLKYAFQTDDELFMILDYLNGGELFFHLSNVDRFDEDRARFYAGEIILALGFLHQKKVVYRDLKPENLLLDMSGHCCLTDFGLVKEDLKYDDRTYTFCGSPEYLAPEILLGRGYGKEVDWWALGTFLYEMLEGLPPFYDDDVRKMNEKILNAPLVFPKHFSPEAKALLRGLLNRDPTKRLGAGSEDAKDIMRDPFFRSINWDDLYHRRMAPSFRPHLASITDTRYFDPQFTSQTPKLSYVEANLSETQQAAFNGFTFMCPSVAETVAERENFRQEARRTKSIRRQAAPTETYHSASAADYLLAEHFPVSSGSGPNSAPKNMSQP
ncbi:MAG: protein kinase [archaeon]|nr:protein kinase [archaeon]